jgi:hypothetical protein
MKQYPYNQLPLAWIQVVCPECGTIHPKRHELQSFNGTGGIEPQVLWCKCGSEIRMGVDPVPIQVFLPPCYNELPV